MKIKTLRLENFQGIKSAAFELDGCSASIYGDNGTGKTTVFNALTAIIEALFMLAGAIITCVLVPYIKSKTTAEQQKEINAWVKIAVTAAEQIYAGQGRGEEKKAYVLNWLRERGVTVDAEKLDALIEAAVYDLTNNGLIAIEQGLVMEEDNDNDGAGTAE